MMVVLVVLVVPVQRATVHDRGTTPLQWLFLLLSPHRHRHSQQKQHHGGAYFDCSMTLRLY